MVRMMIHATFNTVVLVRGIYVLNLETNHPFLIHIFTTILFTLLYYTILYYFYISFTNTLPINPISTPCFSQIIQNFIHLNIDLYSYPCIL